MQDKIMKKLLTLTLTMILASCSSTIVEPETVSATDGLAKVCNGQLNLESI